MSDLAHVDVRTEAKELLVTAATWILAEADAAADVRKWSPPKPGGGFLKAMTLDEALSRAGALEDGVAEKVALKIARKQAAAEAAGRIFSAALRTIVGAGLAAL